MSRRSEFVHGEDSDKQQRILQGAYFMKISHRIASCAVFGAMLAVCAVPMHGQQDTTKKKTTKTPPAKDHAAPAPAATPAPAAVPQHPAPPPVQQTAPPVQQHTTPPPVQQTRSEERRVRKECRSRWSPYH